MYVRVKPRPVAGFRAAPLENARGSLQEPGVARFDVLHQLDGETSFLMIEVYREAEDADRHKQTAHYQRWRDAVASMMAEARTSLRYTNVSPGDPSRG